MFLYLLIGLADSVVVLKVGVGTVFFTAYSNFILSQTNKTDLSHLHSIFCCIKESVSRCKDAEKGIYRS